MPRFYFDFTNGSVDLPDDTGASFATAKDARQAAISLLPDVAQDTLPDGDQHVFSVRLRDESGRYIFQASLSLIAQDLVPTSGGA